MLDKGPSDKNFPRQKTVRKPRLRTIDVRISIPTESAAGRLAGKIHESVSRTLTREGADAACVTIVEPLSGSQTEAGSREAPGRATPAGCGAWWAF